MINRNKYYSDSEIINNCAESVEFLDKTYISHEWSFKELNKNIGIYLKIFSNNLFKNTENIKDITKMLFYAEPKIITDIVFNTCNIKGFNSNEFSENKIYNQIPNVLEIIIKQNDVLEHCKHSQKEKQSIKDKRTIFDTISSIMRYQLCGSINFKNFEDKLTYKQILFYQERIINLQNQDMLNYYYPLVYALGQAFGNSKEGKKESFESILFSIKQDSELTDKEKARKAFFYENWNNKEEIEKICKEKGLPLEKFYD